MGRIYCMSTVYLRYIKTTYVVTYLMRSLTESEILIICVCIFVYF